MSATAKLIQDAIVAKLGTVVALAGVPIVGRRKGVITNDIEAQLATLGACIYVFPTLPVDVNPNLPGPYVDKMQVKLRVIESPALNETLPDAYELAEIVLTNLHECLLAGIEGINPLICLSKPIEEVPDDERMMFDITFTTSVGLPAVN